MGRKPWESDPDNRPEREPPEPQPPQEIPDGDDAAEEIDFDRPIPGEDNGQKGA